MIMKIKLLMIIRKTMMIIMTTMIVTGITIITEIITVMTMTKEIIILKTIITHQSAFQTFIVSLVIELFQTIKRLTLSIVMKFISCERVLLIHIISKALNSIKHLAQNFEILYLVVNDILIKWDGITFQTKIYQSGKSRDAN